MLRELFFQNFMAILQILSISGIGFIIFRRKILPLDFLKDLARFIIYVTLPSMLITKVSVEFNLELLTSLIFIPVIMLLIFTLSAGTVWFLGKITGLSFQDRRFHMALGTFMNTVYLPLGMVSFIMPEELQGYGVFIVTMCLFISTPLLWSVGVYWVKCSQYSCPAGFQTANIFSVPFITMVIGMAIGLFKDIFQISTEHFLFQNPVFYGLDQLGQLTTPLALFVLGGMLAGVGNVFKPENMKGLLIVVGTRLIIIPGIFLLLLFLTSEWVTPGYYMGLILTIEAAAPPAMNLSIISRHHNAHIQQTSTTLITSYLCCIITIPVWMTLYTYYFS